MKKLATLLFTFALAFTLAMPVFAQDTGAGDAAPKAEKASKKEKKASKKASKKSKKEKKGEETPKS
ncbi:MAG TPA: hypothetical protein VFM21_10975 [Terriglobia bacterium]|nr:hypothetical protein [Terriglobia bacterium]